MLQTKHDKLIIGDQLMDKQSLKRKTKKNKIPKQFRHLTQKEYLHIVDGFRRLGFDRIDNYPGTEEFLKTIQKASFLNSDDFSYSLSGSASSSTINHR